MLPKGVLPVTIEDIEAAAARIAPYVHRTPVLGSRAIDAIVGARVSFKAESLQRIGAFKIRGATNAVRSLDAPTAARGVATHSSGNHAAALALAAKERGIAAHVVMPSNSSRVKVEAVRGYGARIVFCEPTLAARESTLSEVIRETGAHMVHPFDDPRVIAGQGTAALELLHDVRDLDVVMTPVGGGGLASGSAIATTERSKARYVGAEPLMADDAARSMREGKVMPSIDPKTIADGLRTSLSERTFAILSARASEIVTVSEEAIVEAMRLFFTRMKLVVEPSGAVPLAALLEKKVSGERIGIVISGGNVDPDALPW